jgi:hypothetical protein
MPRVTEISDKFFNRDEASQTLSEFTSALIASETRNADVGINLTSPQDFVVNGANIYNLLADRGTGRVYEGLKSLELMSRVIKGLSATAVTLFDNKIIAFSAEDMRASNDTAAIDIINSNLGMKEVYDFAKNANASEVVRYNVFVSKIARQIKAGGFKTEDHLTEALVRVKALVKAAMGIKVVK